MVNVNVLVSMVKVVTHNRVIPQEKLAEATTSCAKLLGAKRSDIPQLIKEVECKVTFQLEVGELVK